MWKITKLKSRLIKCTCCYDQSINQTFSGTAYTKMPRKIG